MVELHPYAVIGLGVLACLGVIMLVATPIILNSNNRRSDRRHDDDAARHAVEKAHLAGRVRGVEDAMNDMGREWHETMKNMASDLAEIKGIMSRLRPRQHAKRGG